LSLALKRDTSIIRDALSSLQANVNAIRDLQIDAQKREQYAAAIEWLSPIDFPSQQHDIIKRRAQDTGQWFIDSLEAKGWLHGSDRTLFCYGMPGAGKTMMAAIATEHLYAIARSAHIGIAYVFCNYKTQTEQTADALLAALLKQLAHGRPHLAASVLRMHEEHALRNTRPSAEEIFRALESVCSGHTVVYFIVDALDECSDSDGTRGQLIDKLRDLQAKNNLRLLFTSRDIPGISQEFQSDSKLEVRASEEDVRQFVAGQIHRLPGCIQRDPELQSTLQNKIVEAVDGMYVFPAQSRTHQILTQALGFSLPTSTLILYAIKEQSKKYCLR
jgi:Cdc6-like AAA superfamily ATPase